MFLNKERCVCFYERLRLTPGHMLSSFLQIFTPTFLLRVSRVTDIRTPSTSFIPISRRQKGEDTRSVVMSIRQYRRHSRALPSNICIKLLSTWKIAAARPSLRLNVIEGPTGTYYVIDYIIFVQPRGYNLINYGNGTFP